MSRVSRQHLVDSETLATHHNDADWVVFDCRFDLADSARGLNAYRAGHIPGAYYAHLDDPLSSPISAQSGRHPLPDSAALRAWFGERGVRDGVQVVAYDDSGGSMAVRVWWLLRWLDHADVAVLDGGWQAWCETGLPQDAASVPVAGGAPLRGQPNSAMLLDTGAVQTNLETREWLILDARTGERFRGEQEPIDPVAGHIPNARSAPLQDNLRADGRFRSAADLRTRYLELLGEYSADKAACMCGSGVSACHNLLAMELAGLGGARLYAGSWSEWIREPGRPVAIGR
jgi:thiosulfate/3-mercaptopyruvate sulfurtransferase